MVSFQLENQALAPKGVKAMRSPSHLNRGSLGLSRESCPRAGQAPWEPRQVISLPMQGPAPPDRGRPQGGQRSACSPSVSPAESPVPQCL